MKNNTLETLVGFAVLIVTATFILFASNISSGNNTITSGILISAEFSNVDGINVGSDVKVSGVKVGSVTKVELDRETFVSILTIKLRDDIGIPDDSVFKVSTSGLIGAKFINVKIGSSEDILKNGNRAEFTESSMDLEDLISRFLFNGEDLDKQKQ